MLPREIEVEHWPDRETFDLPRRPIGALRFLGLPLMGFGILFGWSPGKQVWGLLQQLAQGRAGMGDWILGVGTLLFVIASLVPFALGMFIFMGRTRIRLNSKWVRITECAGPFRWSRRIKTDSIVAFEVAHAGKALEASSGSAPAGLPSGLLSLGALAARKRFGKPALLLLGYPRDWVEAMAGELSSVLSVYGHKVAVAQVEVSRPGSPVPPPAEVLERPAGSNVIMVETPEGIQLDIPPRGFFKESHGLFVFGVLWCLFVGAFTFAMGRGTGWKDFGALAFIALFWCVGLTMVTIGLHLGTRRWTLKADSFRLQVVRNSILKRREWSWQRTDIRRIQAGRSGVEVNHRPLDELQVHPVAGRKKGFMTGRSFEELSWMATLLSKALKLEAVKEEEFETVRGQGQTRP